MNTSRLFIKNHNYAVLNQPSPGSFPTALLDLTSKDRRGYLLPCATQLMVNRYLLPYFLRLFPDEKKSGADRFYVKIRSPASFRQRNELAGEF